MRTEDLAAIAIGAVAASVAALLIQSVKGTDYYCPPPWAAAVATLFAPCQAFDTAMGHKVSKKEAVQMGLLRPEELPAEPATRLAEGSVDPEWINPKAVSASMQMSVRPPLGFI